MCIRLHKRELWGAGCSGQAALSSCKNNSEKKGTTLGHKVLHAEVFIHCA